MTTRQPKSPEPEPDAEGDVKGVLAPGEDEAAIVRVLRHARQLAVSGELPLLVHVDAHTRPDAGVLTQQRADKLRAVQAGRAKRYVFRISTSAGDRIVKIAEPVGLGNRLSSLWTSVPRQEHHFQCRVAALDMAASTSCGYYELRHGLRLIRACQVQTVVATSQPSLDEFLAAELKRWGDAALEPLAHELARMHAVPFFHADLKGFHGFVRSVQQRQRQPSKYQLHWIDLARVSFHMTPRKRLINLYQALRFIVPDREEAQTRFVRAYCGASGWYAHAPDKALRKVKRFLAYKRVSHPNP